MIIIVLASIAIALADGLTTTLGLHRGYIEANPFQRFFLHLTGNVWTGAFLGTALMIGFLWVLWRFRYRLPIFTSLIWITLLCRVAAVISNIRLLA